MRRIHVIGRKNSGKTTLVVELIEHLTGIGYRIGTIKHTHHRHELDTPGKDSHRHRVAGAGAVGIVSRGLTAVFQPLADEVGNQDAYAMMAPSFGRCDLVIVEGDSMTDAPKIEVWRTAVDAAPLATEDRSIRALVTDDPVEVEIPIWGRTSIASLVQRILSMCEIAAPGVTRLPDV